ncbi:hypothetical protein H6G04_15965 [Calothrix membranacea FACHB-236]|nr:hypothetical protein [Calothrix membranacea FACHB-236]
MIALYRERLSSQDVSVDDSQDVSDRKLQIQKQIEEWKKIIAKISRKDETQED